MVDAVTGAEIGGAWSELAALQSPTSAGTSLSAATAIACVSAGSCEAVGLVESSTNLVASPFTAISVPQLTVATTSLPAARVGTPYSATVQAAGGAGNNAWSTGPGTLPAGLTLDASTGMISGTPTAAGQSGFIVTDGETGPLAQTASAGLSITVNAVSTSVKPPPLRTATVRVLYLRTSGEKATLSLRAGRGKKILLALSHRASKLLGRLHTVSVYLRVTLAGAPHPAVVKKVKFTSNANQHHGSKQAHHKKKN